MLRELLRRLDMMVLLENRLDALVRLHTPLPPAKIGGAPDPLGGPGNLRLETFYGPNAGLTEMLSPAGRTSCCASPRPTKPPPSAASPRRRLGRWRKDDRRSASRGYDHLDQRCETLEIGAIEGQQPALAMRQHRCDDVGVMDLTAAKGEATAQL